VPLRVWAQGMGEWRLPQDVAPIKWALLTRVEEGALHARQLGCALVGLLTRLLGPVALASPTAASPTGTSAAAANSIGVVLHPMPLAKRVLSDPASLPHLAQVLLPWLFALTVWWRGPAH
jgi:hypothetical protein